MLATVMLLVAQVAGLPQADQLYRSGEFEEAHSAYSLLLARNPGDPGLLLRVGVTEYELRRYSEAVARFRDALKSVPEMQPALVGLGTALVMLDRPGEAVPILEKAVNLAPDPMARRALGHAYSLQNDLVKGEALLRRLAEENPHDDEAWLYLGTLLFQHNYNQAALESLEKHLELRPSNTGARIYRAGALAQLGRHEEAAAAFRSLEREPAATGSTDYLLGYAQLLFRTERFAEALQKIDDAIKLDGGSAKLLYWRARILAYLGRSDEAVSAAERSVSLDPGAPGARALLIRLYGRAGLAEKVA